MIDDVHHYTCQVESELWMILVIQDYNLHGNIKSFLSLILKHHDQPLFERERTEASEWFLVLVWRMVL